MANTFAMSITSATRVKFCLHMLLRKEDAMVAVEESYWWTKKESWLEAHVGNVTSSYHSKRSVCIPTPQYKIANMKTWKTGTCQKCSTSSSLNIAAISPAHLKPQTLFPTSFLGQQNIFILSAFHLDLMKKNWRHPRRHTSHSRTALNFLPTRERHCLDAVIEIRCVIPFVFVVARRRKGPSIDL